MSDWTWRETWRAGIAPQMTTPALRRLLAGLEIDDPALVQGVTTIPAFDERTAEAPCVGGCAVGYALARERPRTVGEVEDLFGVVLGNCDRLTGSKLAWQRFASFFDCGLEGETAPQLSRREVLARLRAEVDDELTRRALSGEASS